MPRLDLLSFFERFTSDFTFKAEYDVSHVSMSIGSGGGAPFGFPGVPGTPIVVAYGDSASSTTHAAIADGAITIRDKDGQQQDIAKLSNDTANAANPLDKIFNAEEEMRNLEAIGLAGQIVQQVTTIATNIGVKAAQDEAHAKADAQKDAAANDPAILAEARANLKKAGNENPTQEDLNKATYDVVYQREFTIANEKQMKEFGTGSDVQRAIQAAGAALTVAMGGGSAGNAAAAASAPYLAQGVKVLTEGPEMKDKAINAIAHAIVGAAVAQASGNSAASGAIGAASGELMAQLITEKLYDGRKPKDLTEAERQTVAALSMIAAGAVGGVAGDSTESAVTSANAGYNAAVNNYLSTEDITTFTEKYANAKTDEEREQLKAELSQLDKDRQRQALATGIPLNEQRAELDKLKQLAALADCVGQCQELVNYSISELEPVVNNPELHQNNIFKGVLAGVIYGLTVEKPSSGNANASPLTREQEQLIKNAEYITTAKGIQNPFPRDLNEKVLWNQVKANPASGTKLDLNNDPRFPTSAGFQKMEVVHKLPDKSAITIHYQYNSYTGKAYDMKITTPQRNINDPSKVVDSIKDVIK